MTKRQKTIVALAVGVIIFTLLLTGAVLFIVFTALDSAAEKDSYSLSGDEIPSIKSVVGYRRVNHYSSGTGDGEPYREITYTGVENPCADIRRYVERLLEEGFYARGLYDTNDRDTVLRFYKLSEQPGKVLELTVAYTGDGYWLRIKQERPPIGLEVPA
ncbi:MAG: hypothetical protein FWE80_10120 [Oscillospiraceae bacterium]|nr:hypothetical protein [Oscillospiraceae bacterium]